MVMLKK